MTSEARALLWLAVAGALALAGVVGAAAALGQREFDEIHARLITTALAGLLCGGAALAALEVLERELRSPLAWICAALGVVSFFAIVVVVWRDWEDWERPVKVALSAIVVSLAALVLVTVRRVLRLEAVAVRAAALIVAALIVVETAGTLVFVWGSGSDDLSGDKGYVDLVSRALVAILLVVVAGFFAIPALERATALLAKRRQRVDRGAA